MKKLIAILLAALMLIAVAACAPEPAPAEDVPSADQASDEPADAPSEEPAEGSEADGDWDYIAEKGELVIGITYYQPMNYLDENNELTGFETEFAQAVCEKLGVKATFQVIDWELKETELAAKNIDVIWNGLTVTEERKQNMEFSVNYMANAQVCVIQSANADKFTDTASMADATMCAEKGSAGESAIADNADLSKASYTAMPAQSDVLLEVKSGTTEIGVLDRVMAGASIGEGTDYSDLMMVPDLELTEAEFYAIGARKGAVSTIDKLNAAIQELADEGFMAELAAKYGLTDSLAL